MNFSLEYTKEQAEFAREVNQWLDANVPKGMKCPQEPLDMTREEWEARRQLGRKLGEKGWLYPGFPKQYGGGGLPSDLAWVIQEELEKRRIGLPPWYDSGGILGAPAIMACATEEQKSLMLPPILKGEVVSWELFTEPEAGTDEANQQTNALRHVREKDHFIINGQKIFVGGVGSKYGAPDQFLLLTRSDLQAPRHENLAMFMCSARLPGITILPLDLFDSGDYHAIAGRVPTAAHGMKHSVFFDDVRVNESYLIGKEHDGWAVAQATLMAEHGGLVRITHDMIMERFIEQCRSNPNIMARIDEDPLLLNDVAEAYIGAQVQRLLTMRNAYNALSHKRAAGYGPESQNYMKLFGARISAAMARVLGPYSFTTDDEWTLNENTFDIAQRGAICTAPAGTIEAMKIIISRGLAIGR